jgi:tetratricopeptide (TPR) repeat protein
VAIMAVQQNPRWTEGRRFLQSAQWQEAIACFEQLARDEPDNRDFEQALEDARFRAHLDSKARVRGKRWVLPWRSIVVRVGILLAAIVLTTQGVRLISVRIAPLVSAAREERRLAQLAEEGTAYLEAGRWDDAEDSFTQLLEAVPDDPSAIAALETIAQERRLEQAYGLGVALQAAGDLDGAVQQYTSILVSRTRYRDVIMRMEEIRRQRELDQRLAQAEADYQAGLDAEAAAAYRELRQLDAGYKRDLIDQRLYVLYMRLGRGIISLATPSPDEVPLARDYFTMALTLDPHSTEATQEQRLTLLFLEAQSSFHAQRWDEAIARFRAVYDERPGYLGGIVADMLYESYIKRGEQAERAGDVPLAYELYRKAAALPVADVAFAKGRMFAVASLLTPTPTPTLTPTVTPTPTLTPTPTATPIPTSTTTATPTPTSPPTPTPTPVPLRALRNQIVFRSDDPEEPGLWAMDAEGQNRRYLGYSRSYETEYKALLDEARWSPDRNYHVYVTKEPGTYTPLVYIQGPTDQWGNTPTWLVSKLSRVSYDPVWSPDGSRIAFVSQENGSDDIWVVYTDGSGAQNLTRNIWEWDKHPSWSPNSSRLVFWSNRTGVKQIFVIDVNGQNLRNLSNTVWDEYDPIWIR